MSDYTNRNPAHSPLEITRATREDELQSAKILFQEGLIDEAKKKLFQILICLPNFIKAQKLLQQIQDAELREIFSQNNASALSHPKIEDANEIIRKLNDDLNLSLDSNKMDPHQENWVATAELSSHEHYDLAVAYFEMECYRDALRELKACERQIRMNYSFLGSLGVAAVALTVESLVRLGLSFQARIYLEPILTEPDLNSEEKTILFYGMALIEESLGKKKEAHGWFQKVSDFKPDFRDIRIRLKQYP